MIKLSPHYVHFSAKLFFAPPRPFLRLEFSLGTTIKIKIIYPRGKELYSSSRRTAVVPLFKNYMLLFLVIAAELGQNRVDL